MMEKKSTETCKKCKGLGGIYFDKPKVCQNCQGQRCYKCDRRGPFTFFEECNICWGNGIVKKELGDSKKK
tara:strand:- start:337 stop:546 length:210 start_codon:yes stop_codon:yes gene_type:complete